MYVTKMRQMEHVEHIGEMRNAQKILIRNLEGMKQFGRPRHKWENNIKRNLKGIRYESVD
jgi:hypothetical protein